MPAYTLAYKLASTRRALEKSIDNSRHNTVPALDHCALIYFFKQSPTRNQYLVVIKYGVRNQVRNRRIILARAGAQWCAIAKLIQWKFSLGRGQVRSYRAGPGEKLPHPEGPYVQCLKA